MTVPSSLWSKTSGAMSTHWPAPMQCWGFAETRMTFLILEKPGLTGDRSGVPSPADRQRVQSEQHTVVLERQVLHRLIELKGRDPPEQALEDGLHLDPDEVLPETLVHAVPERDVVAGRTARIELVGPLERLVVMVRRGAERHDFLARPDELPADLDVLHGHAERHPVGDGQVAQHLLDHSRRVDPLPVEQQH